ncbi:OmpH family outer membrane protein [Candidatus Palauibacter sp.]|uniref:OmpH family outer membrane protein n=1 Tax=Candidatus Palauibacter sp. TaxID=3101350 RepID=UPI003B0189E5
MGRYATPAGSPASIERGPARLVLALVMALAATGPGALAAQAEAAGETPLKIGVINVDVVALQSPAGQAFQQELAAFQEEVLVELQARQETVLEIETRVAEADSLSVEERRVLEREYQDALTEFQRFQQDKQEEATVLQGEGQARIREEIGPVIAAIQSDLGYDLVLNSTSPIILFFSERIDITQLAIERLAAGGS